MLTATIGFKFFKSEQVDISTFFVSCTVKLLRTPSDSFLIWLFYLEQCALSLFVLRRTEEVSPLV